MTLGDWLGTWDPYALIGLGWLLGALSMICVLMVLVLWGHA